jgi:hypothetical protein
MPNQNRGEKEMNGGCSGTVLRRREGGLVRCGARGSRLIDVLLALIKRQFRVPTCRVNVWNNHVFTLSTNLVP